MEEQLVCLLPIHMVPYPKLFLLIPWVDSFSQNELLKYGAQGVVLPLNDPIDQHAPNIKAALEQYPNFMAQAIAPNGKIYGLRC